MLDSYQEYEIFNQKTYQEVMNYEEKELDNVKGQSWEQIENNIEKNEANNAEIKKAKQRQAGIKPKVKKINKEKQEAKDVSKSEQALWKQIQKEDNMDIESSDVTILQYHTEEELRGEVVPKKGLLGELSRLRLDDEE